MKINLITEEKRNRLETIFNNYPKLILQNKGYEYIRKDSLTEEELSKFQEVTEILSKAIYGFTEFNNFRRNKKSGKIELRFQYNYGYDGGHSFVGVGYILLEELYNGFPEVDGVKPDPNLKVELGKSYILRDGRKTEPLAPGNSGSYKFGARISDGNHYQWLPSGRYLANGEGRENMFDIVKEYVQIRS